MSGNINLFRQNFVATMDVDAIRHHFEGCLAELAEAPDNCRIGVRDLSDQFYCEYQVELAKTEGEVETPDKQIGRDMHEALREQTVSTTPDEMWDYIETESRVAFAEFRASAEISEVYLLGQADYVRFDDGRPTVLIETMTSGRPTPYPSQQMQAWLYARILDEMGFDTNDLCYVIYMASKYAHVNDIPRDEYSQIAEKAEGLSKPTELPVRTGSLHVRPYTREDTFAVESREPHPNQLGSALDWALEWIRGERETTSTTISGKCDPCDYRAQCDRAVGQTR